MNWNYRPLIRLSNVASWPTWQTTSSSVGQAASRCGSKAIRRLWETFLASSSVWLIFVASADAGNAYIEMPRMKGLVDDADLIIIAKIESVQTTPAQLWRQIRVLALLTGTVPLLAFLLWRKRIGVAAACLAIACLLGVFLFDIPSNTYRKLVDVSVSSTIKGPPPPSSISVYYDNDFARDDPHFDVQQEYLLFLKELPSGYAMSWSDWSAWTINAGYAQTEKRARHNSDPIAITELLSRIRELRDGLFPEEKALSNGKENRMGPIMAR